MNEIEEDLLHMLLRTDNSPAADCARSLVKCWTDQLAAALSTGVNVSAKHSTQPQPRRIQQSNLVVKVFDE